MTNDREKLIELLEDIGVTCEVEEGIDSITGGRIVDIKGADYVADHLLSHGVTFAKDTDIPSKLVSEAISHFKYGVTHDIFAEPVTTYANLAVAALENLFLQMKNKG